MQHQHSSQLPERGQRRTSRAARAPRQITSWATKYLKPYAGLFIASGVIALAFLAVWLWFALR